MCCREAWCRTNSNPNASGLRISFRVNRATFLLILCLGTGRVGGNNDPIPSKPACPFWQSESQQACLTVESLMKSPRGSKILFTSKAATVQHCSCSSAQELVLDTPRVHLHGTQARQGGTRRTLLVGAAARLNRLRGAGTIQEENQSDGSRPSRGESSSRARAGRRQRLTRGAGLDDEAERDGERREHPMGLSASRGSHAMTDNGRTAAWDADARAVFASGCEADRDGRGEGAVAEPFSNEVACAPLALPQREEGSVVLREREDRAEGVTFPILGMDEHSQRRGTLAGDMEAVIVMEGGREFDGDSGLGCDADLAMVAELDRRKQRELARQRELQRRRQRTRSWERAFNSGPMGPNDTVQYMTQKLKDLIELVETHPSLHGGSASFMRDYLRTLIYKSSEGIGSEDDSAWTGAGPDAPYAASDVDAVVSGGAPAPFGIGEGTPGGEEEELDMFDLLPDETVHQILSHLDGPNLDKVMHLSDRFKRIGGDDVLWQHLCLSLWPSLKDDESACALLEGCDKDGAPVRQGSKTRWRALYPSIALIPTWPCTLIKSGRAMCNLLVHNVAGARLPPDALSSTLVLERRFPIGQLLDFVSMEGASILYFEPETPEDQPGYEALIEYLLSRDRVGLGVEADRRIMYIPPCDFTRSNLSYAGKALMGIVQKAGLSPVQ